jgi:hypothetical protein
MLRVGMVRRSKRKTQAKRRRHSRRCIFRYKNTRKQHMKQKRQRGGVSDDLPTIGTVGGFPVVSMKDDIETSVLVPGQQPMSAALYKKMAGNDEFNPRA